MLLGQPALLRGVRAIARRQVPRRSFEEGADLLVVRRPDGGEALIPFVAAIVPTVDVDGGFLVIDPPEGLLEL